MAKRGRPPKNPPVPSTMAPQNDGAPAPEPTPAPEPPVVEETPDLTPRLDGAHTSQYLDVSLQEGLAGMVEETSPGVALGVVNLGRKRQAIRLELEVDPDGELRINAASKISRPGSRAHAIQRLKLRVPVEMRRGTF